MKTRKCKVGGVDTMLNTFLLGHSLDRWHSVAPVNSFLILPSSPIPLLLELQIYVLR